MVVQNSLFTFCLSPLLIPLNTIMTSLQQSVAGHKNLYGSFGDPNTTELVKQRSQMTAIDKRNIEILIKVGSPCLFHFTKDGHHQSRKSALQSARLFKLQRSYFRID